MSLFKRRETPPATPAAPPSRSIDPAAYGFVPASQVRNDRAGPAPDFDIMDGLLAAGQWHGISNYIGSLPMASERRFVAIGIAGRAAAKDDTWLRAWLRDDPKNSTALAIEIESLVDLAWEVRTSGRAETVGPEQWKTFARILNEASAVGQRAVEAIPADPAPFLAMMNVALGLGWDNDQYRGLWSEVIARAPHSFTATHRAWNYLRPRWHGSLELVEEFVEGAIAAAPLGSNLTMIRIQMLYDEFRPDKDPGLTEFHRGERMGRALDQGIADAAASDPNHIKLPYLRHWLAFELYRANRHAEAIDQFRAIGGFAGAEPWDRWQNAAAKFCQTRTESVLAWEDAGRPAR